MTVRAVKRFLNAGVNLGPLIASFTLTHNKETIINVFLDEQAVHFKGDFGQKKFSRLCVFERIRYRLVAHGNLRLDAAL